MSATPTGPGAPRESVAGRSADARVPRPRLLAFAATLVLAATTGLPMGSAGKLIPHADDPDGPFLGI